ncbi:murein hydrolase activator EnvC family protein [Algirhabdus cladophorae]|uniref:murein hydrolase activator EnvC family protein n=1 Tax=Algirhabdus cladophorae TaxID=3377108 RepID=UPI003B845FA3
MRIFAAFSLICWAGFASAQSDPSQDARLASQQLEAAVVALDAAQSAKDRVTALTETVHAFEDGLAAMRDGLRHAALREQAIEATFAEKDLELQRLLASMQRIGRASGPLSLMHPAGALGTARAGMLVGELAPSLRAEANVLKAQLDEVSVLRQLQSDATEQLKEALSKVQIARTALSDAIANRTDLPKRFTEDPVQTALLISSTETLGAFATGLIDANESGTLPEFDGLQGQLPLPVDGAVLRSFEEADAAGIKRPGWIVATAPAAMVTSPVAATLRYQGPLLDYGTVVILEPANDTLLILAGMQQAFGAIGDVLPKGTPVGLMGGTTLPLDGNLTASARIDPRRRTETLYIELRRGPTPSDPAQWFDLTKE